MLLVVFGFGCTEPALESARVVIGGVVHPRDVAVATARQGRPAGTVVVNRVSHETVPVRMPNRPAPSPTSSHAPCACTHAVVLACPPTLAACVVGTTATRPYGVDRTIPPSPTLERELRPPVSAAG